MSIHIVKVIFTCPESALLGTSSFLRTIIIPSCSVTFNLSGHIFVGCQSLGSPASWVNNLSGPIFLGSLLVIHLSSNNVEQVKMGLVSNLYEHKDGLEFCGLERLFELKAWSTAMAQHVETATDNTHTHTHKDLGLIMVNVYGFVFRAPTNKQTNKRTDRRYQTYYLPLLRGR